MRADVHWLLFVHQIVRYASFESSQLVWPGKTHAVRLTYRTSSNSTAKRANQIKKQSQAVWLQVETDVKGALKAFRF